MWSSYFENSTNVFSWIDCELNQGDQFKVNLVNRKIIVNIIFSFERILNCQRQDLKIGITTVLQTFHVPFTNGNKLTNW